MAFNGQGVGPNQGKEVTTVFMHVETAGFERENVWRCSAKAGDILLNTYGAGPQCDFLECWLEVIEPDAIPDKARTVEVSDVL